jgi:LysR family transcriptional regulator of gallate degradation
MSKANAKDCLETQLHNIRVFEAVAAARSITGASEQLLKAPSAVARSIAELERAIGESLFDRTARGMQLNACGAVVLRRARRIEDEIQDASDELLRATPRSQRPSLRSLSNAFFNGKKLRLVMNVAELRSISAVAARMNLSQGGASLALSRLEEALGQALFHRTVEGLVATEVTERLVVRGSRVLAELRHLAADLDAAQGDSKGLVIVGTTHLGRTHYFPFAIAEAIARFPGIRIRSVENSYEVLIDRLRSGEIDIMFGALRPGPLAGGVVAHRMFTDRMSVVANANHPLARRENLSVSDLIDEKWILPRSNDFGKAQVGEYFRSAGLEPPVPSVETGDLATVRQLLWVSDMLSLISPHQLTLEIQSGLLVELPVPTCGEAIEVGFLVRESAMLPPAAVAVIEAVRAQAGNGQSPRANLREITGRPRRAS